jgi:hypothetical protein
MTKFFGNKYARLEGKRKIFHKTLQGLNFSCTGNMEYLCLEKNRNLYWPVPNLPEEMVMRRAEKMAVKQAAQFHGIIKNTKSISNPY